MNWNQDGSNHMDGAWGWFGGAMMIGLMALIVVGIVALVVWLMRARHDVPSARQGSTSSAREVIDARYAHGEIDESQRRAMIETIT